MGLFAWGSSLLRSISLSGWNRATRTERFSVDGFHARGQLQLFLAAVTWLRLLSSCGYVVTATYQSRIFILSQFVEQVRRGGAAILDIGRKCWNHGLDELAQKVQVLVEHLQHLVVGNGGVLA